MDALVVDDDASFRRDLCECIEASGLTAVGAASGADAIRFLRLKNVRPRVVFLDLDMPEMDGFEFREWLRNERSLRSVPVVLVSGHPRVREYAQRLHATKALLKPISPEQVLACLGSVAAS